MKKAHALRAQWDQLGAKKLTLKSATGKTLPDQIQYENVQKRLRDLARVLVVLYDIYKEDCLSHERLYDDNFLAFIGDKVIRNWPGKDFPFASVNAREKLQQAGFQHIPGKDQRLPDELRTELHYEHWTPISFFRDVFAMATEPLTEDDFFELLTLYYRVVWITNDEHSKLDKKYRSSRPLNTYDDLDIRVAHPMWNARCIANT